MEVTKLVRPNEITSRERHYETIFIVSPLVNDPEAKEIFERNVALLKSKGATPLRTDEWGKKRMAHVIEKHHVGRYYYFRFIGNAVAVKEFERSLKLDAQVIRYQTVKLSDILDKEEVSRLVEAAPREQSSSPSVRSEEDDLEASYSG